MLASIKFEYPEQSWVGSWPHPFKTNTSKQWLPHSLPQAHNNLPQISKNEALLSENRIESECTSLIGKPLSRLF